VRAYLDHASTSPLRPAARRAMTDWLERTDVGDPARIHAEGMATRAAIEDARDQVAACFGARPREVVFTSGATESIATACWGALQRGPHSVASEVEHSAVREWTRRGDHTLVGVDPEHPLAAARRERQYGNRRENASKQHPFLLLKPQIEPLTDGSILGRQSPDAAAKRRQQKSGNCDGSSWSMWSNDRYNN